MAKQKRKEKRALKSNDYMDAAQQEKLIAYVVKLARHRKPGSLRALTNEVIVIVLLSTGLRPAEFLGLKKCDLPCCHGKPVIDVPAPIAKGKQPRTVMIPDYLGDIMTNYMNIARKGSRPGSLFMVNERGGVMAYESLLSKIKIIGKNVGMDWLTPHKFRHTYLTNLYNVDYDLRNCQDQAGHTSIKSTQIYTRTDNRGRVSQVKRLPITGIMAQLSESIMQNDKHAKGVL